MHYVYSPNYVNRMDTLGSLTFYYVKCMTVCNEAERITSACVV